jgi:hypothetical protein
MKYNLKINTFYKAASPSDMRKWYVKNIEHIGGNSEDNFLVHYITYMPDGEIVDGGQATVWQFSMCVKPVEEDLALSYDMLDWVKI